MRTEDLDYCKEAIRHGSLSFHSASKLLPAKVRDPAIALYAFCRLADDAVDLQAQKAAAVLRLQERLDLAYAGKPYDAPADRAFADMVAQHDMPRALPEALLEGLAWDACERRYETLSDLYGYSARVASAVGAMMCVLMGVRDPHALARACDMGVAMQLTNIARDVGEDALEGRIYLPLEWLEEAGLDPEAFLANPKSSKAIRIMTRRLVMDAERLYTKGHTGISSLPLMARPGIKAAGLIYAGIGREVQRNGYDNITVRARTSKSQKLGWLSLAFLQAALGSVLPRSPMLYGPPLPEVAFLVQAASGQDTTQSAWGDGAIGSVLTVMADLKNRERLQRLEPGEMRPS